MNTCPKCGSVLPNGAQFCPECSCDLSKYPSDPLTQSSYTPTYQSPANTTYSANGTQKNSTGLMVWSIINLVCCCLPLGIVGLVFTLTAKNEPTPEAQEKKLKNAMTCNIIGTIVGIVVDILYFVFGIFSAL